MKKIALISLGCEKNLVDSESILGLFDQSKYQIINDLNNAKKALENAFEGVTFELDEISYFANDIVVLEGEDKEKFERLLTMLDDIDDVSNVYHNVAL